MRCKKYILKALPSGSSGVCVKRSESTFSAGWMNPALGSTKRSLCLAAFPSVFPLWAETAQAFTRGNSSQQVVKRGESLPRFIFQRCLIPSPAMCMVSRP
jgi:hypothetical protein